MKQGICQYMPIEFGADLDDVSSIEFKFVQSGVKRFVTYPSEAAVRRSGTNVVDVEFNADETWRWKPGLVHIDTIIKLTGSTQSPETPIVSVRLEKTLFERGDLP